MGIQGEIIFNFSILIQFGHNDFLFMEQMTQRLDLYSESLQRAIRPDFKPQVIRET